MPNEPIKWKKLDQKGDEAPKPRSGHTLTWAGQNKYIMIGGIEDNANNKIVPTPDIWQLLVGQKDSHWEKKVVQGDEIPVPRTQHVALLTPKKDIFVFGGHASPTVRLNDCWLLKMPNLNNPEVIWERIQGDVDGAPNEQSSIGAPDPRANMGATYYNGKVYIYGGHGGLNYARTAFADIFSFDLETQTWHQYHPVQQAQPPPVGRGGNSIFVIDDKLYSYGGWNSESQFTNLLLFDLNTCEWTDTDIPNGVARWNHAAVMVEAIPSWKYFIFGGESTDFGEAQPRTFGTCVNTSCYMDLETMKWQDIMPEDDECPQPREYAAMTYDESNRRLVVFGGWHNGWLDDLYTLDVSKIVGPPYAITSIDPPLGQISGGVPITITGVGFLQMSCTIYFTPGSQAAVGTASKSAPSVQGTFVSETELTAMTPDFGDKGNVAIVQVQFSSNDLTTTYAEFNFFLDTKAEKSLCYGPGMLQDLSVGEPVQFIIQARNEHEENRTSGRDNFKVAITTREEEPKEIQAKITDSNDGKYYVEYAVDHECDVDIKVAYQNNKGIWQNVRGSPYTASFNAASPANTNHLTGPSLLKFAQEKIAAQQAFMKETAAGATCKDKDLSNVKTLVSVKDNMTKVYTLNDQTTLILDQLDESLKFLSANGVQKEKEIKLCKKLFDEWTSLKKLAKDVKKEIAPLVDAESKKNIATVSRHEEDLKAYITAMKKRDFYRYDTGRETALSSLEKVNGEIDNFIEKTDELKYNADKFEHPEMIEGSETKIGEIQNEVGLFKGLWDHIADCQTIFKGYMDNTWEETKTDDMEEEVKKLERTLKGMKVDKKCNAYIGILEEIKKWLKFLPLCGQLRDPSMRERHWDMIRQKSKSNFQIDNNLKLKDIYDLELGKIAEDVEEITDQANQEAKMEKTLNNIEAFWQDIKFEFQQHKGSDVQMLKLSEENFEVLEENQTQVNSMFSSRYLSTFEEKCIKWQKALASISEIVMLCGEVQRNWSFLEQLFIHSAEVKKELPKESDQFVDIDKEVKRILSDAYSKQLALTYSIQEWVLPSLEDVEKKLAVCEKALLDFMDSKRRAFPRFYFVAQNDLLDILSNGNNPGKVMIHMPKIFQAIETLKLKENGQDQRPSAVGIQSSVGVEYVEFSTELKLERKVENYLQDVIDTMRLSIKTIAADSLKRFAKKDKKDWLEDDCAQVSLLVNLVNWVKSVEAAFEAGNMQECYDLQVVLLKELIFMVQGDLSSGMRQKIMCMITMDAHSRDIIDKLKNEGVTNSEEFQWQSQLKAYWDGFVGDYVFKIADAVLNYGYEYLGNGPRLVITPLTDRIYVTATQALHLKMGCAPAGPAGTGKTETTKDLSSALAKAIYVFNCSDQMDFRGMGNIFKGLASSGSWGCFDEFNRLLPSVLSVCSVQFKSVTDAIKAGRLRFILQDDDISLDPTCGVFITMNPGYLGRAELPEGLKALFRPITVVVPDLELICENMLMAEGFIIARVLAKKFTTLYALCKDLLSKAAHYDWGLRAIKSVLVVAGKFKRAEPELPEPDLLMRALRDFNLPKIVAEDLQIFMDLLGDLFPGINPPRKRDSEFEQKCIDAAEGFKLYPDDDFILKVVQLSELLLVRHCVFVMGPPGAGKSSTWKTLADANTRNNDKTLYNDLNPKVVKTDELYGVVHMQTREWIDGLMSKTMRTLGQMPDTNKKWIILDGDLDANWIESMNSVMDDNKILTLASNERIPLKAHMRLLFEIRDLRFATPATVSRAGILFISDFTGYQWRSYVKSWLKQQNYDQAREKELQGYFDQYIAESFIHIKRTFKYLIPQVEISMVVSLCKLLESILKDPRVKGLAFVFVFCCVWCLGAGFDLKDGRQYRKEFSTWWKDKFKAPRFPSAKTVFDYYVDFENTKFEEWNKLSTVDVSSLIDSDKPISHFTVPTVDTIATQYIMNSFIKVGHSPLLIGSAGCGKTQIMKGLLNELTTKTDDYLQQIINFNYYTDSMLLQTILEQQLERRTGKIFGPVGKYKLIYFIDDLNMPALDKYDTQSAIALVRQHKDYEHWYDRAKLQIKEIKSTMYVASMNPTAGSFVVNPRLQRHFFLCAIQFPEQQSLFTIFSAFLNKHFSKYKSSMQELVAPMIKTALNLHSEVERSFQKTSINFHYEFNVRHLSNVFQGILQARHETIKEPDHLVQLWAHECERIYGDRLVSPADLKTFKSFAADLAKKAFPRTQMGKFYQEQNPDPLIFANFVASLDDKMYDRFPSQEALSNRLQEALRDYNDTNAVMDLVLFEDAMKHCCKISRIISAGGGHALLVGVGGSGKQSLSRLSSAICTFQTVTIVISSSYGLADLKVDLQKMYMKAGVKDEGLMFLFTEGQITNERFLVFINDLLSSGEISDLFPTEDIDGIVASVRNAVKSAGLLDNKDNSWKFFIDRVRKNLHMALCFSPVGDAFRNRAKKFPALINNTVIDWFHPWPQDALLSVADKFLEETEMPNDEIRQAIVAFMPYSFTVVNEYSEMIKNTERRFVYTTPKSFLELVKLFKSMLDKKLTYLDDEKTKFEIGVGKLKDTEEAVAVIEAELKVKSVEVEEAKKSAGEQATVVGAEKEIVDAKAAEATIESEKANEIASSVHKLLASVQKDLDAAEPLVEKAMAALKGLQKKDFDTLKALNTPPDMVRICFFAVINLYIDIPDVDYDLKKSTARGKLSVKQEDSWKISKNMMKDPNKFMEGLNDYKAIIDEGRIPPQNFAAIQHILSNPEFTPENLKTKAEAASGVCNWLQNINLYYDVVVNTEPKRQAVEKAKIDLEAATAKKDEMEALVNELQAKLDVLMKAYQSAMDKKQAAEDEAARCERRLSLANRLVSALGSEKGRWSEAIVKLGDDLEVIHGDVLLASSFVSYVGPFNKSYRDQIMNECFVKFFKEKNIPTSQSCDPLDILTDEASIASWNNQKLPSDRVSIENGSILTNSDRYSLIIDPQLQGIAWLKEREKENDMRVTRLSNPKMIKILEAAIEGGQPVMLENLENAIDAVIQPVYARAIIKRGKNKYIKMGDKELSLHNNFNLYLHTKLQNPHYPPEIQAECTLINFTVTESGLEDQLLALVVKKERPDLAAQKETLIQDLNGYKIKLRNLQMSLLRQLAEQKGDILDDITLIENLEDAKKVSNETSEKVSQATIVSAAINETSEQYRPAANRGALVFFLMNELYKIHSFYKFSLDSFVIVVKRAIDIVADRLNPKKAKAAVAEGDEAAAEGEEAAAEEEEEEEEDDAELTPRTLAKRVNMILDQITFEGFSYTRRGTFEAHKLVLSTMLTLRINVRKGLVKQDEVDALIRKEVEAEPPQMPDNLAKFLLESVWPAVIGLQKVKIFEGLSSAMESEALQWKRWYGDEKAEVAELPKSFKDISPFHRILLLRALRPDRLQGALTMYVTETMGMEFIEQPSFDMVNVYNEMDVGTPAFFVLFPGVDPTPDVERVGALFGKSSHEQTFTNISMGQGQEQIALNALKDSAKKGNWLMIQNVHLMTEWMRIFERALEVEVEDNPHKDFRCFISSEAPGLPHMEIIPESILQNSIKVSNQAPQDLKANLRRAMSKFDAAYYEKAKDHKYNEFKALIFGLIMFHALILGRRKFGSQGWSKFYSFNDGDLTICGDVLHNYLSKYDVVPYQDLRYIYGEIMYGGHITDDWDRITNRTYLEVLIRPEIMTQMQMTLQPGFKAPDPAKFEREQYEAYIEDKLPAEQPAMFGLHPNAEIGYLTTLGETIFSTILSVSGASSSGGAGAESGIRGKINSFLKELPDNFNMIDIMIRIEEKTPFMIVAIQECEKMNNLLNEIRFSLTELDQGLDGALNITEAMEVLQASIEINVLPPKWAAATNPTKKLLIEWFAELLIRVTQLQEWTDDIQTPNVLWISALFNPMSYLTAIMQVTARAENLPLDDICLRTEIKNTDKIEDFPNFAEKGAFINGLFLEGAAWENGRGEEQGYLVDQQLKELHPILPIVHVTAIPRKDQQTTAIYSCPVYVTTGRGPTFVFTAGLQLESEEQGTRKWILAGTAIVMSPE